MKRVIIASMAIGFILSACNNIGNKAETKEAEKVEIIQTDASETFKTIKEGSFIEWRASHLGGIQPRFGKIFIKDAKLTLSNGTLIGGVSEIEMSSLTVENFPEGAEETGKLAGHLLSADFFDIEHFPTSKFELTSIKASESEMNSEITGNLTILGITKSITFFANVKITENEVSLVSEDFSIDRRDWGLSYNTEGTEGVPVDYLIADNVGFKIQLFLKK
jgi:polyisoprenoid-binding protein YceI